MNDKSLIAAINAYLKEGYTLVDYDTLHAVFAKTLLADSHNAYQVKVYADFCGGAFIRVEKNLFSPRLTNVKGVNLYLCDVKLCEREVAKAQAIRDKVIADLKETDWEKEKADD